MLDGITLSVSDYFAFTAIIVSFGAAAFSYMEARNARKANELAFRLPVYKAFLELKRCYVRSPEKLTTAYFRELADEIEICTLFFNKPLSDKMVLYLTSVSKIISLSAFKSESDRVVTRDTLLNFTEMGGEEADKIFSDVEQLPDQINIEIRQVMKLPDVI